MEQRILLLNLGSTSLKFKLYGFGGNERVLAAGECERVGHTDGAWRTEIGERKSAGETFFPTHKAAFAFCAELLSPVLPSFSELSAIGYKAVLAGPVTGTCFVDERLMEQMERFSPLAPAHNPVYLNMMRTVRDRWPDLIQIARFETAFHSTIPLERTVFGVPYEWVERFGIRRYGFHGSSHEYIAGQMKRLAPYARRVISAHLGGSSSVCAILDGKSVACSMGATPQSGLFHNNRVGDFDVFCLPALTEARGGLDAALKELSSRGGFLGLSGVSNDLREVFQAMDGGNRRAELAVRAFTDEIVGYIGMFSAYLGGLDALAFTGGIGLHSDRLREMVCEKLSFLQVEPIPSGAKSGLLSRPGSKVQVWALETNEELVVARHVRALLNGEEENGSDRVEFDAGISGGA